jgi:hypothetical protein
MSLFKSNDMQISDIILVINFLRDEIRGERDAIRIAEMEEQVIALKLLVTNAIKNASKEIAKELATFKAAETQKTIEFKEEKKTVVVDAQTNINTPVEIHKVAQTSTMVAKEEAKVVTKVEEPEKKVNEKRENTLRMRNEAKEFLKTNNESAAIAMIKAFYAEEVWVNDEARIKAYIFGMRKELGMETAAPKKEKKPVTLETVVLVKPIDVQPEIKEVLKPRNVVAPIDTKQELTAKKAKEIEDFKASLKTVPETVTPQEKIELERAATKPETKVIEHPATAASKNVTSSAPESTISTPNSEQKKGTTTFVDASENADMSKAKKEMDTELANILYPNKNTTANRTIALQTMKIFAELYPTSYISRNINKKAFVHGYLDTIYSEANKAAKLERKRADKMQMAAV